MRGYDEWESVDENENLGIRTCFVDPQGYGLHIKKKDEYLFLPRKIFKEIAETKSWEEGINILERLTIIPVNVLLENSGLTKESLFASIHKAYKYETEGKAIEESFEKIVCVNERFRRFLEDSR